MSKSVHVALTLLLAGMTLSHSRCSSISKGYAAIGDNRERIESERIESNIIAKKAASNSGQALNLFKAGCIELVKEGKPIVFTQKTIAWDNPSNKQGSVHLDTGTVVCNQLGQIAIVGQEGRITDIKIIGSNEKEEFDKLAKLIFRKSK
jgi:hypothetical protein